MCVARFFNYLLGQYRKQACVMHGYKNEEQNINNLQKQNRIY